ncbi:hypothetical protein GCM10011509_06010 [Ornithinimicrobium pekingense]|uniref:N-acetylmuramic acid 6-phosphate etherase n=2 Tax=Ornithinimicrobium pekingense TaxID=384677 RepID=A0ABQ2F599_9MICO|nr:hypothetical protein GCM10011509_06010 [Ornithinimicrobium pekingense]
MIAVDLGKTGCRLRASGPDGRTREGAGPGAVGLAAADGVQQVCRAVDAAARDAGLGAADRAEVLVVGLVGYHAASARRDQLGQRLLRRWASQVVLTGDVATTHVGALGGRPGAVVAAGTGAVALAVDDAGRSAVRDGWGFLLGDDGSGYAVGRDGLRAALLHVEGRPGGSAALAGRARDRYGDLASLPSVVHSAAHPSRLVAGFVPDVVAAAREGDGVSAGILEEAGRALARTGLAARAAVDAALPLCLAGGLVGAGAPLTTSFAQAVGGEVVAPRGGALDGAVRLGEMVRAGEVPAYLQDLLSVHGDGGAGPVSLTGDLDELSTEGVRLDLMDLEERGTEAVLRELWSAEATVVPALLELVPHVAPVVDAVVERLRRGGRMFYVGAGTPARLAFVDASELPPTYGTDRSLVVALPAGGTESFLAAKEGAEDDRAAGRSVVEDAGVGADDVVVGLTASGRTPFVVAALQEAGRRGALTVSFAGNRDAEVSRWAQHALEVETGPEVISGSTRLKAGTAQKLFLNALSTTTMVGLGKTYGPYMVDMQASNDKLRERAVRMVRQVTGCPRARAEQALEEAGWHTKTALLMVLQDLGAGRAREALHRAEGSVREALRVMDGEERP